MNLKIDIKSKNEVNKVTVNHVISVSQPQSIKFNKKKINEEFAYAFWTKHLCYVIARTSNMSILV